MGNGMRVLTAVIGADFRERTRRYSFLITLAVMVYMGYVAVPGMQSQALTVDLGALRGIYNSAWIGSMMALLSSMVLSLPGFYLVKNAIERDRETGVGQIMATTPLSKPLYTMGKSLSNFIFLAVIVAVMVAAAGGMQLIRGESLHLNVWALLAPFMFTTLPTLALVAAVAVFFESISFLRGGFGNLVYFALWVVAIGVSMSGISLNEQGMIEEPVNDLFGASVIGASMHREANAAFPDRELEMGIGYTVVEGEIETFRWEGVRWTAPVVAGRLLWAGVAVGVALLAAVFFHRFDPARAGRGGEQGNGRRAKVLAWLRLQATPWRQSWQRLAVRRWRLSISALPAFGRVLLAEMGLMLKGFPWWWYIGALGFIVAGAANGVDAAARRGLLVATWIWPVLMWSGMGVREKAHRTTAIVFSAPRPIARQFTALWLGGVLVTALTGGGVGARLLVGGEWGHLLGWVVAVLFIPTLALALGVWSGTGKTFEALYVALWYVGPLSGLAIVDYMGVSPAAVGRGVPFLYLGLTVVLFVAALMGRRRQIGM